jgi:uncharacterized protein
MRIVNLTRSTVLGTRVVLADSWWGRFRGYLGRREPQRGEGILLVPCNAVHTYGMAFELDVIFLGADGGVLHVIPKMGPWRRSPRVPGCRYVLEVPPGTIQQTGTSVGDSFTWTPLKPLSLERSEMV